VTEFSTPPAAALDSKVRNTVIESLRAQLLRRGEEMIADRGEWAFGALVPVSRAFRRLDDGGGSCPSLPPRLFFEVLRRLDVRVGRSSEAVVRRALDAGDGRMAYVSRAGARARARARKNERAGGGGGAPARPAEANRGWGGKRGRGGGGAQRRARPAQKTIEATAPLTNSSFLLASLALLDPWYAASLAARSLVCCFARCCSLVCCSLVCYAAQVLEAAGRRDRGQPR
jgi:hypothetical protein